MKKRGISLIGTLWLVAMLGTLAFASLGILSTLRNRLEAQKLNQESAAMAISGRDYAATMIASGQWKGPQHFRSPVFSSGGSFEVDVRADGRILSIGHVGAYQSQIESQMKGKP